MARCLALSFSGLALAALLASGPGANAKDPEDFYPVPHYKTQRYSFFKRLKKFDPATPLEHNEMRISFMGSMIPPIRRAQQSMSIFVQVGTDGGSTDQVVFDAGSGVCANYAAMGIGFGEMNKIFVTHLHADHAGDLSHIYCFGPSGTRKGPLYIWSHGDSEVVNPASVPGYTPAGRYATTPVTYNDGVVNFCTHLREAWRWHSESFSFEETAVVGYPDPATIQSSWNLPHLPAQVSDDPWGDGYALVPIELPWNTVGGLAYFNANTGMRITHFPVVHTRQGSMGYKLEWNGLSMMYTSDTKPETISLAQANSSPLDVFIHEMALPPEVWAMKNMGLDQPGDPDDPNWETTLDDLETVEESSHSPQGAFGYLLGQLDPRPRLAVATHFPTADDTVQCALLSVQEHCPDIRKEGEGLIWSTDLMVIRVFAGSPKPTIQVRRAVVSDYTFSPPASYSDVTFYPPKYHKNDPAQSGDPHAQIDLKNVIWPTDPVTGEYHYKGSGY